MPSTKELKQRIKGIKSTSKITRAMEMISAVKMRKAVAQVVAIRPYAQSALQVLAKVSQAMKDEDYTLFRAREVKRVLLVVITANRGLCGSFNTQIIRQVKQEVARFGERGVKPEYIDFVSIGKKGDQLLRQCQGVIKASFPDALTQVRAAGVRPIARLVREEYESGCYDKVMLIYTDYVSPMVQKTNVRRLLPLSQGALQDEIGEMEDTHEPVYAPAKQSHPRQPDVLELRKQYQIEPTPEMVLEMLIPRLIEMQIHHAILESNASQEAARMMAMRNATDAAKDMVADFTLSYNQLRQAKVTQEIAELSAGMAAVNG
ncbi:MAG: ATP synthase F1 subunit gamma [Candidatus Moranbacteria bacterium]|nr:ATP synthase F1 subunit gamma [Candidatus Moranbacteria bacterium]